MTTESQSLEDYRFRYRIPCIGRLQYAQVMQGDVLLFKEMDAGRGSQLNRLSRIQHGTSQFGIRLFRSEPEDGFEI